MNSVNYTPPLQVFDCIKQYVYYKDIGSIEICTEDDSRTWLCCFYVQSKYRHKGIGTRLMEKAIKICKKRNIKQIYLKCKRQLIDFYRRFGFVTMANTPNEDGYYTM